MNSPRKSDSGELLSVSGIADLLGMGRTNVYKWLSRRGLEPVRTDPLPVGRLYDRGRVLAERDAWLGERDRAQDERRRASARRAATHPDLGGLADDFADVQAAKAAGAK